MTEEVSGPRPLPLDELSRILWAARIDATANRWHLVRRAIPRLRALAEAGDSALGEAAKHADAAVVHLDAMVEEFRRAIDLIQPRP